MSTDTTASTAPPASAGRAADTAGTGGTLRVRARRNAGQIALTVVASLLAALWLVPFGWALSTSLKPEGDTQKLPLAWIQSNMSVDAYRKVLGEGDIPAWLLNSVIVSTGVTVLTLTVCALAAYGFARTEFRFRKALFGLILAGIMVPGTVITAPQFANIRALGMVDTYWGVILPQVAAPAMLYILYKFFQAVPPELEEAATIDGAGRWRIFFRIVLPLSRPVLAAVAIFTFIASWNNFLWPYLATTDPDLATLPVGLATIQSSFGIRWAQLMAMSLLAALPLLIVFVFFQRQIVRGVAHTGIAGQ